MANDIRALTLAAVQPLVRKCPIVVIACNTATAAAIDALRYEYPQTIFVGFEPSIKPASKLSHTRHVTLLSTSATAAAPRTQRLIRDYGHDLVIDLPDTRDWAYRIDHNQAAMINLSPVRDSINSGSDTIIIACTHYLAIESQLSGLGAQILEPTEAIARRLELLIAEIPLR